jgi:hypothetical protein
MIVYIQRIMITAGVETIVENVMILIVKDKSLSG